MFQCPDKVGLELVEVIFFFLFFSSQKTQQQTFEIMKKGEPSFELNTTNKVCSIKIKYVSVPQTYKKVM